MDRFLSNLTVKFADADLSQHKIILPNYYLISILEKVVEPLENNQILARETHTGEIKLLIQIN